MTASARASHIASPAEVRVVYAAAVVQGIALVTFPAASSIFTDPKDYGLSSAAYGAMTTQAIHKVALVHSARVDDC